MNASPLVSDSQATRTVPDGPAIPAPVKKVLFIAYHFPPAGGGGVQRSLKFVKYLPECGFAPIVLTAKPNHERRWTPTDQALADEVPASVKVHQVELPEDVHVPSKLERAVREMLGMRSRFGLTWMNLVIDEGTKNAQQDRPYRSSSRCRLSKGRMPRPKYRAGPAFPGSPISAIPGRSTSSSFTARVSTAGSRRCRCRGRSAPPRSSS
jgi:hypothetical protein